MHAWQRHGSAGTGGKALPSDLRKVGTLTTTTFDGSTCTAIQPGTCTQRWTGHLLLQDWRAPRVLLARPLAMHEAPLELLAPSCGCNASLGQIALPAVFYTCELSKLLEQ